MADFLGAESAEEVLIGPNMTTLTYQISRSLGKSLEPGDEIIVTRMDHEGNVSPWLQLAEDLDLEIRWLEFNQDTWKIEEDDLKQLLNERTRILALNYASNLTGSINDVVSLTKLAKEAGVTVYVDAVQYAPHGLVDVQKIGCDFLTCSAYKFYGPHLGVLWGRKELLQEMYAYKCRCSSENLPERFETGTPQIELLAGLTACIDYLADPLGTSENTNGNRRSKLMEIHKKFNDYENTLGHRLIQGLQNIKGVKIQGITDRTNLFDRVPTVSVRVDGHSTHDIAKTLATQNIFVWSGHNYALEIVRQLGIDEQEGVLRIGIGHYNTAEEVDETIAALENAVKGE